MIQMTNAAIDCIRETGCDPNEDVDAILGGRMTASDLRFTCLDGADADRVQGWRDYIAAVLSAVEARS